MKQGNDRIRLAIIGCGAITQISYLPAAAQIPNIAVTHLVDLDIQRALDVAEQFGIPNATGDYREAFGMVDAVIVATPPASHAPISIECMKNRLPVLCEKPLAMSLEEANKMVAASEETGNHLAVGMIRRLSWSSQLLKKLVASGMLGNIQKFETEEGWEFGWPLRTGHMFDGEDSKGVILDTGTHLFDLFLWILESEHARVMRCNDDNWGGREANALVELEIQKSFGKIMGTVELSFTRRLRNTMKIYGERGYLEASNVGSDEVLFYPAGKEEDPVVMKRKKTLQSKNVEGFALQLSIFANSVMNNIKEYVSANEVLPTVSLVEECYRLRKPAVHPWEAKHLEKFLEGGQS